MKDLMLLQIRALDAMMENLQDEELAIVSNDRIEMERVLTYRKVIVDSIRECQIVIAMEMGKMDLNVLKESDTGQLNSKILWMNEQINKRNNRNKILLKMRLHI